MLRHISPSVNGGFVAEDRQRKDLALVSKALEPLDGNKAVDRLENRPQIGREIEIFLFMLRLWPNLENDGDHLHLPCVNQAELITPPGAEMLFPPRGSI